MLDTRFAVVLDPQTTSVELYAPAPVEAPAQFRYRSGDVVANEPHAVVAFDAAV